MRAGGHETQGDDAVTTSSRPRRVDGYAPIADYGVIGDTRTVALVARDGSLDWLCLPNVDDASVFAALLDRVRGGRFLVGPTAAAYITRRYVADSTILATRFATEDGVFEVTDFMPIDAGGADAPFAPARRVIRAVEALEGAPGVVVDYAPRPEYGAVVPKLRRLGGRAWVMADGRDFLLLQSDIDLTQTSRGTLCGEARLQAGERRVLSLSHTRNGIGIVPAGGESYLRERDDTLRFWQKYRATIHYDGPFAAAVVRSMVTLRLLTFSLSGAVVAAPTCSLPEAVGGTRNWDYRYCWLRDAAFVLHSFLTMGLEEEGAGFFRWLTHATQLTAPRLQTLYTVFGRTDVREREIRSLEGYRRSSPVNLGNGAESQLQLDAYGAILTSALIYADHGERLGRSEQGRLRGFADVVRSQWTLPDNGLWEMRGGRKHNTYSKVMCWAALDAVVKLCERGALSADPAPYVSERDAIRTAVMSQGWNAKRGAFTGAFGHDFLDASVLLMPRLGIIAADDPRMVATFTVIDEELGHGAQLRRYSKGVDGFQSTEGTFTACGFWAVDYLARRGDVEAAYRRMEALVSLTNDLLLLSEEIDPETGDFLGNFPQGFSHTGLVGAALALNQAVAGAGRAP
ncbi:MAG: glycoside hydrolase family 15 protein [Rhodospirillales bacterium]|nr:glycoside hydrolase family 15 protein [Rhodospirillales bacterium]